jgi:hypothetical protein
LESLSNPNITKEQVADILVLNHEAAEMSRQSALYRQKMATTSKVIKSHMSDLKTKGVQIENERELSKILEGDNSLDIKLSEGLVQIIDQS